VVLIQEQTVVRVVVHTTTEHQVQELLIKVMQAVHLQQVIIHHLRVVEQAVLVVLLFQIAHHQEVLVFQVL
jgi:hypothetical protein